MKPIKNRVFCNECRRTKMLFESENKALNFLRFNAGNFEGTSPTRVYYCSACFGWHVTSREGESYINPLTDIVVDQFYKTKKLAGTYGDETLKYVNIVRSCCGEIKKAKRFNDKTRRKLDNIHQAMNVLGTRLITSDFDLLNRSVEEVAEHINMLSFQTTSYGSPQNKQ